MDKPNRFRIEYAGWGFWAVCTLILIGPMTYVSYQSVQAGTPGTVPVGMGIVFASMLSAFVTWLANTALQSVQSRKKQETRKQAKRKK